ncbi:MAG: hypothetical protein AAGM36_08965 [Cyanobacteria bacterium J06597_1]
MCWLSLKGNQGRLHADVKHLFIWTRKIQSESIPHEFYQTLDGGHGRIEIRRWVLDMAFNEDASRSRKDHAPEKIWL